MKFLSTLFKTKELNPAQRIRKGESVSIEEICEHLRATLPPEEQTEFFNQIQLSVYPVVIQKLLEFKDNGKLTNEDFFKHLRDQTNKINLLLDKKNETKIS